jgi:nucleoside-diphosphate kinase
LPDSFIGATAAVVRIRLRTHDPTRCRTCLPPSDSSFRCQVAKLLGVSSPLRPEEKRAAVSERTLVLVKPDGVSRGLVGEVISRIERKGLTLAALELRMVGRELAEQHYVEHADKPFFGSLLEFITSAPVVAAVVEGERAVAAFRQLAGGTDPVDKAAPGSIRGDFALETQSNLVHGSDSVDSAKREIALWFPEL